VSTPGNVPGSYREPAIGWMTGFLLAVSFVGLLTLLPLRKVLSRGPLFSLIFPCPTFSSVYSLFEPRYLNFLWLLLLAVLVNSIRSTSTQPGCFLYFSPFLKIELQTKLFSGARHRLQTHLSKWDSHRGSHKRVPHTSRR
jgi:hypothetical protein